MLSVYAHEGEFNYQLCQEIMFQGNLVFVEAATTVVYGMNYGDLVWEFDTISIIDVTDMDGEQVKLTADEEKELVKEITAQLEDTDDTITHLASEAHEEYRYYNGRR